MTFEGIELVATEDIPLLEPEAARVVVTTAPVCDRTLRRRKSETLRRIRMRATLRDGTVVECHGARYFAPREPVEDSATHAATPTTAERRSIEQKFAERQRIVALPQFDAERLKVLADAHRARLSVPTAGLADRVYPIKN